MKLRSWTEHRSQRVIQTGDGHVVASEGDTVIVIIAQRGDRTFKLLDDLLAEANTAVPE